LAGANISGNLKNPQTAIPKGTLLAILITSSFYVIFSWSNGATVLREATGIIPSRQNDSFNATFFYSESSNTPTTNDSFMTCAHMKCKHGLLHNYHVMEMVSVYGPIITAGIVAASLSSALASMVSAPKIFQAVCADKIFKKSEFFAKGHGKDNEPWLENN
jgi:amino acid transporter